MFVANMASRMMRHKLSRTRYVFQPVPEINVEGAYGVYIHIPFCLSRCNYCPFYSEPALNYAGRLDEYTQAVVKEISNSQLKENPDWLYIGGGTPNILSVDQISRILDAIRRSVHPGSYGIELLPALVNEAYLHGLANIGISKISMGVQTFTEPIIRQTGRKYLLQDEIANLVKLAQSFGIWVSLDLMVGLENQTPDNFQKDLEEIVRIAPDQLAIYPFIRVKGVDYGLPSLLPSLAQYKLIESSQDRLERIGYRRDTAWIFSRGNGDLFDSSGNEIGMEYIGFGAGAYSVYGKWKSMNPPLRPYLHGIQTDHPMAFMSSRKKSNEDMRHISKMIYHLVIKKYPQMSMASTLILKLLELSGFSHEGNLTNKGRLLSHEISKAAMESLPFPIQDPSSVDNLRAYHEYCRSITSEELL